jgi:lipopolysaccharide export system permease protein
MTRLDRYLMRRFAFSFVWSMIAFWAVFIIVHLVEHLDDFMDKGAPAKFVALYYLYFSPYVLVLVMPIAVLLATLFSVGFLSKQNELLAMRAAGASLVRLALPLLFLGIVVTGLVMAAGETIYPEAEARRTELEDQFIRRSSSRTSTVLHDVFATGLDGRKFYFRTFNAVQGSGTDVTVQTTVSGRVTEMWEIKDLRYEDSVWIGDTGRRRIFSDTGDSVSQYTPFTALTFPEWKETPEDFVRKRVDPNRTGYRQLKAIIERMRNVGADTTEEDTELALKLAFPFLSFLVVLVGFPIAARSKQTGMALNFGIAMGITFVLRVLIEVFRSLGHNGDIPAWLAAWAPNIVCLIAGIVILLRVRK